MGFKQNLERLLPIGDVEKIVLTSRKEIVGEIPNAEGKRGSLQVYLNLLNFQSGEVTPEMANSGIELFAEYSDEARGNPSSHPNIQRLFAIQRGTPLYADIVYSGS